MIIAQINASHKKTSQTLKKQTLMETIMQVADQSIETPVKKPMVTMADAIEYLKTVETHHFFAISLTKYSKNRSATISLQGDATDKCVQYVVKTLGIQLTSEENSCNFIGNIECDGIAVRVVICPVI